MDTVLRQSGEVHMQYFGKMLKSRMKESISSVLTEEEIYQPKVYRDYIRKGTMQVGKTILIKNGKSQYVQKIIHLPVLIFQNSITIDYKEPD